MIHISNISMIFMNEKSALQNTKKNIDITEIIDNVSM